MVYMRGTVYLYRTKINGKWVYKFYKDIQPSLVDNGEFELVFAWPDCNKVAALGWVHHKYGAKECHAPNGGVYRLSDKDIAELVKMRKLPPGTTGRLWWEGIED